MNKDALAYEVVGNYIHGLIFLHANFLRMDGHVANAVFIHTQGGIEAGLLLDDALGILQGVPEAIVELANARQVDSPFPI